MVVRNQPQVSERLAEGQGSLGAARARLQDAGGGPEAHEAEAEEGDDSGLRSGRCELRDMREEYHGKRCAGNAVPAGLPVLLLPALQA